MKHLSLIIILLIINIYVKAQVTAQLPDGRIVAFGTIYKGDTIPLSYLDTININAKIAYLSKKDYEKYQKLIRNVKIVYPYAKQARQLMDHYNSLLTKAKSESERKKLMKQAEEDIKKEFEPRLKKLTRSQGAILIRLVDRETGNDTYALVKTFRGRFRAFFYQAIGSLFGFNLKTKFDPKNNFEDMLIEKIIKDIENQK